MHRIIVALFLFASLMAIGGTACGYGGGGGVGVEREKHLSERLWIADCGLRIADWTVWVSSPQADFPDRTGPRKSAIRNPKSAIYFLPSARRLANSR